MMQDPLGSWQALVDFVSKADEQTCLELLKREKRGRRRLTHLLRIHSRLNRVRADRERGELAELAESYRAGGTKRSAQVKRRAVR
jgi:uncharacterized protein YbgA (DUF1722 family)